MRDEEHLYEQLKSHHDQKGEADDDMDAGDSKTWQPGTRYGYRAGGGRRQAFDWSESLGHK